jgi:hypothetical protein
MNNSIKAALLSILMLIALPSNGQTCNDSITPSTPTGQFTQNRDGTVTDNKTTLTWMRCSLGQRWDAGCIGDVSLYNWQEALAAANNFSFAEQDDWRLPNIKELLSIGEQACYSPAFNANIFPNISSSGWWSSSPIPGNYGNPWFVQPYKGTYGKAHKDRTFSVRLVRGGQ